jgi:hypothetical protein
LCSKELTWLCLDDTMIRFQSLEKLGSFTKLRVLEMNDCHELIELPPSIGNLSLLTKVPLHLTWMLTWQTKVNVC